MTTVTIRELDAILVEEPSFVVVGDVQDAAVITDPAIETIVFKDEGELLLVGQTEIDSVIVEQPTYVTVEIVELDPVAIG